eukprot:scaffold23975_cov112-Isochrysis_galbana.AAC.2
MTSCDAIIERKAGSAVGVFNQRACAAAGFMHVGTIGSSKQCTRGQRNLLLHFQLPVGIQAEHIETATLSFYVAQAAGNGADLRLDGLGTRSSDELAALQEQTEDDFHVGWGADPMATEIEKGLISRGWGVGATFEYNGQALLDYVRAQVEAGGAGKHLVLRLSARYWYSCMDTACEPCGWRRFSITRTTEKLALTGIFADVPMARSVGDSGGDGAVDPAVLTALWSDELFEQMEEDDERLEAVDGLMSTPIAIAAIVAAATMLLCCQAVGLLLCCRRFRPAMRKGNFRDSTGHKSVPRTSFGFFTD